MIEPSRPQNEDKLIAALRSLEILDTPPEEQFDRITRLAAHLFDVPIVLVSLINADRKWFKSQQGPSISETPCPVSFFGHAILIESHIRMKAPRGLRRPIRPIGSSGGRDDRLSIQVTLVF